jgi:hypothetical protein
MGVSLLHMGCASLSQGKPLASSLWRKGGALVVLCPLPPPVLAMATGTVGGQCKKARAEEEGICQVSPLG